MRVLLPLVAFVTGAVTPPAFGQSATPGIGDRAAQAIISGCVAHAQSKGQSHAIAVMGPGGNLVAFRRMDGNGFGIGEFAIAKAEAAAAWGQSTRQLAAGAQSIPGFERAPKVVTVPGGLPVHLPTGERVGAVGVSGETPDDDEACARAGVEAAGLRSERPRR